MGSLVGKRLGIGETLGEREGDGAAVLVEVDVLDGVEEKLGEAVRVDVVLGVAVVVEVVLGVAVRVDVVLGVAVTVEVLVSEGGIVLVEAEGVRVGERERVLV